MPNFFTHYWKNDTWDYNSKEFPDYINHTASNIFVERGVQVGDFIYVVTAKKGVLLVAAKMPVNHLVRQRTAEKMLSYHIWPAQDHAISNKNCPANYDCAIPKAIYPKLYFESSEGPKPPFLIKGGLLYQQTLRGVRQLTQSSAELLDEYLGKC